MIWKNQKPTPKTTFRVRWTELLAALGVVSAVVLVVCAFFYGYNL